MPCTEEISKVDEETDEYRQAENNLDDAVNAWAVAAAASALFCGAAVLEGLVNPAADAGCIIALGTEYALGEVAENRAEDLASAEGEYNDALSDFASCIDGCVSWAKPDAT